MQNKLKYLIGVDGGGSGTRVIIQNLNGETIASALGPPSALGLGVENAWRSIISTAVSAFYNSQITIPSLGECAVGMGLSGVNNIEWRNEFLIRNPGLHSLIVDTDGYTTLVGAHQGVPGSIVALGTGSVGMILKNDGSRQSVSGWGFPSGDEASGSWLGIRAIRLAEKVIDGRKAKTILTDKILKKCGNNEETLLSWLSNANQNTFATLAPLVFESALEKDQDAITLLHRAGSEVEVMLLALDPHMSLPFSICGRLGEALIPYLPEKIKKINQSPKGNSADGALFLIKNIIK